MNWNQIRDLGDGAVMAPACIAIAIWLVASRAWSKAIRWLWFFGSAAALVVGTKIAFEGWGIGVTALDFTGVSGHAMTATSVFTVAGYLLGSKLPRSGAIALAAIGYGFGVLVGVSGIVEKEHSLSEVVAGCALGGLVAYGSMTTPRTRPVIVRAPAFFALTLAALIFTLHGAKAPSELYIAKLAVYLSERATPYSWPNRNAPIAPDSLSSSPDTAQAAPIAPADPTRVETMPNPVSESRAALQLSPQPQASPKELVAQESLKTGFMQYCAPPIAPPSCVDDEETYKKDGGVAACQKDIDGFIGSVFKYRSCLSEEVKKTISNTNAVIDHFKCRSQGKANCPQSQR
jgi:hypothetical protein